MDAMTYNRMFTLHGVIMIFLFMIPAIPGVFGNFFMPAHDRRARTWPSRASTCSRVYLYLLGAVIAVWGHDPGRHRHRLDLLHALQHHHRHHGGARCCSAPSSSASRSILTGLNFIVTIHTLRAPGHDLDAAAALRLGHLRHQRHPGAGHAGAGHDAAAGGHRAGLRLRASSTRPAAATRSSSSTSSGSTRTRPSTS